MLILDQSDGVNTGVRNLIRAAPPSTQGVETPYGTITLLTLEEMLRIKSCSS